MKAMTLNSDANTVSLDCTLSTYELFITIVYKMDICRVVNALQFSRMVFTYIQ